MNTIQAPCIKLKQYLDRKDYELISELQERCVKTDGITLKIELDYRLAISSQNSRKPGIKDINEFMYYDGEQLIGYIGICSYPGSGNEFEITGMVHPEYRRQGVFSRLHELVLDECKQRKPSSILVLCDKKSIDGLRFIEKTGAVYKCSEYEMYLQKDYPDQDEKKLCGITMRKAVNSDALEIARQNEIYFGSSHSEDTGKEDDTSNNPDEISIPQEDLILPEEEVKRGMLIYMAQKDTQIIGKVHLETINGASGIYGLGVLPEHRGKGYGRAILLSSVKKLREENISNIKLQVAVENATALNLYKSCGFVETSSMDYFDLMY